MIKVSILVNKSGALSISLVALVAEAVSVSAVENETLALGIASDFISGNWLIYLISVYAFSIPFTSDYTSCGL